MRNFIFWACTALIVIAVNFMIFQKEKVLGEGTVMLVRLAPVDPRSLMQGDYMALRYALPPFLQDAGKLLGDGCVVVDVDANCVATAKHVYDGKTLAPGEHLLAYKTRRGTIWFGANAYFFQEGQASLYNGTRYGELRVDRSGKSILTGLRSETFQRLGPPTL